MPKLEDQIDDAAAYSRKDSLIISGKFRMKQVTKSARQL